MLKKGILFFGLWFIIAGVKADEGMWLPHLLSKLNYEDMKTRGLELSAEEIYSINQSSLKDAIVSMGNGFCTGEIISPQGLLITNHHCTYDHVQQHSTIENDILTNGFWASNFEDEIPIEGLFVRFLVRIENVTDEVLGGVSNDFTENQRQISINRNIARIVRDAKRDTHYDVDIKSFYGGNEYYLFAYEIFRDVRLVGNPPESIGKFGGDTDNWMWPRHTGDFTLFRIYMNPDGLPAEFSLENIPLKPRHHLPVSLDGIEEGDFAMILGYPARTDRYLTSYGVKLILDETNPTRISIRGKKLTIMKEDMDADSETRLKYAAKYAKISNYHKYFIGQSLGLENLKVYDKKLYLEKEFKSWIDSDPVRKKTYNDPILEIKDAYPDIRKFNVPYFYIAEAAYGIEIVPFSNKLMRLESLLGVSDKNDMAIDEEAEKVLEQAEKFFKDYNMPTDEKVFTAMMEMFYKNVPVEFHPDIFIEAQLNKSDSDQNVYEYVKPEYDGDFHLLAHYIYSNSILTDKSRLTVFLKNPDINVLRNDPGYQFTKSIKKTARIIINGRNRANRKLDKGRRLFIMGLREMNNNKIYYPDANRTMRFTYGNVLSYEPRDAVIYEHITTLNGVMEKEDPGNFEFLVPAKLKELHSKKDYGQYADKDGEMVVAFLTNHDITGGNSGSPVINARGELIGIAFDGNWEAMSGNMAFEHELQRCINVDIRYALFIIDKFAGASHLIDEMTLVKSNDDNYKYREKKKNKRKKSKTSVSQ
ncbi:S46 family peptidase [Bacteroidota bacterium]